MLALHPALEEVTFLLSGGQTCGVERASREVEAEKPRGWSSSRLCGVFSHLLPLLGQAEGSAKGTSVPTAQRVAEGEVSSRRWLLTSAESQVPGTGLGSGVLNAAFLVKGRWGLRTKETMCGTEARALSSGLADLGLRTKRVVGTVILTPSLRETSTRVSHRPASVLLPSIPW